MIKSVSSNESNEARNSTKKEKLKFGQCLEKINLPTGLYFKLNTKRSEERN